ncbi:hypothetical protein G8C92_02940 [Paenibacillus donghaensis]|uniref:hypothetical protein n=1 Tax=Paenibacillus TaxID=44249 RepID=UPI001883AA30|nr:hypothetical protein [Paenibacillus donghaensis]MBE9912993.1 hypothetical protein [Paenibacillus donghaensis]
MEERVDWLVMLLIGLLILIWIAYGIRSWLFKPLPARVPDMPINDVIPDHPAVDLLEKAGYEVFGGKIKIPLLFEVDGEDFHSRLFIDFLARNDEDRTYLVKVARNRLPMDWTGSSIRDRLLPYFLLYPGCAGVLYVDVENAEVACIHFDWDEEDWNGYDE